MPDTYRFDWWCELSIASTYLLSSLCERITWLLTCLGCCLSILMLTLLFLMLQGRKHDSIIRECWPKRGVIGLAQVLNGLRLHEIRVLELLLLLAFHLSLVMLHFEFIENLNVLFRIQVHLQNVWIHLHKLLIQLLDKIFYLGDEFREKFIRQKQL